MIHVIHTEGVECYCPYGYDLSDDESFCQDVNECEIYGNDDEDGEGDGEEEENVPRATFCSHTCTNLIGLFKLNIYFSPLHCISIMQHQKF